MISEQTLEQYGAVKLHWKKGEVIFRESEAATYFYQISRGLVKLVTGNSNDELVQGLFARDESFGEPSLLCEFPYPATAVALDDCDIWKMSREKFLQMLKEDFQSHLALDRYLCMRLENKSQRISSIAFDKPEKRVLDMVAILRKKIGNGSTQGVLLPVTRQQIADMTGLRVETVIRTVRHLEKEGKLRLVNHKIVA